MCVWGGGGGDGRAWCSKVKALKSAVGAVSSYCPTVVFWCESATVLVSNVDRCCSIRLCLRYLAVLFLLSEGYVTMCMVACLHLQRFFSTDSRKMLHFCAEKKEELDAWFMAIRVARVSCRMHILCFMLSQSQRVTGTGAWQYSPMHFTPILCITPMVLSCRSGAFCFGCGDMNSKCVCDQYVICMSGCCE